jgi:hypothetical protein
MKRKSRGSLISCNIWLHRFSNTVNPSLRLTGAMDYVGFSTIILLHVMLAILYVILKKKKIFGKWLIIN